MTSLNFFSSLLYSHLDIRKCNLSYFWVIHCVFQVQAPYTCYIQLSVMRTNYNSTVDDPRKTNNDIFFPNNIDQGGIQIIKYLIYKMFYSSLTWCFFSCILREKCAVYETFEGSILLLLFFIVTGDFYVFAKSIFELFSVFCCIVRTFGHFLMTLRVFLFLRVAIIRRW